MFKKLVCLVIIIFLLAGMVAAVLPPSSGGSSSGSPSSKASASENPGSILVDAETKTKLPKADLEWYLDSAKKCTASTTSDCWSIDDAKKELIITGELNNPYQSGLSLDNGVWSLNKKKARYSPDGMVKVSSDKKSYKLDNTGNLKGVGSIFDFDSVTDLVYDGGNAFVSYSMPGPLGVTAYTDVNGIRLPTEIVDKYRGYFPPGVSSSNNKLGLTNDGELWFKEEKGISEISVKLTKDSLEEISWTLANGETYDREEGWKRVDNVFENKDDNLKITVELVQKNNEQFKITEMETDSQDRTETILRADGSREVLEYDNNKLSSAEIYDREKNVLATATIANDKIERYDYLDARGRVMAVCVLPTCLAGKDLGFNNVLLNWVGRDEKGYYVCTGSKTQCVTETGVKVEEREEEINCEVDPTMSLCQAIKAKKSDDLRHFEGNFWDTVLGREEVSRFIGGILNLRPGWQGLSSWLLPEETQEWQKWAAKTFDRFMLVENLVPEAMCSFDKLHETKRAGENAVMIQLQGGITQAVGAITAETTKNAGPVLCGEELPCLQGECQEGLCKKEDTLVQAYFYKISWGVTAPRDEEFTPFLDENGIALKYNVQLIDDKKNKKWLYQKDGRGTASTLMLVNGESDGDSFVAYSPNKYEEACIIFSAPPEDRDGEEIKEICATFITSEKGEIQLKLTPEEERRETLSSQKTGGEGVSRVQI